MAQRLDLLEVMEQESNVMVRHETSSVISSPFRRDSSPSFRIYYHPEEDDGASPISKEYSAQDWGTGKTYNPISYIHEIRAHDNWAQTFEYLRVNYGITLQKSEQVYENKLPEYVKLLANSVVFDTNSAPKIEKALLAFMARNELPMNELLSKVELTL